MESIMKVLFGVSLGVFILGVALFAFSGISFRLRALANKRAWDGATKPLLLWGIIVAIIGLVGIYFTYPTS